MDIVPLWVLGGWLIFPFSNCMATPKSQETHSKSHHFYLLFLLLLLIFVLLSNPTKHTTVTMPSSSSIPIKRLVLESSPSSATTMNLHPKQAHTKISSSKSKPKDDYQFGAEKHEVPSGPNPISN